MNSIRFSYDIVFFATFFRDVNAWLSRSSPGGWIRCPSPSCTSTSSSATAAPTTSGGRKNGYAGRNIKDITKVSRHALFSPNLKLHCAALLKSRATAGWRPGPAGPPAARPAASGSLCGPGWWSSRPATVAPPAPPSR